MEGTEDSNGLRADFLLCERSQPPSECLRRVDTGACLPTSLKACDFPVFLLGTSYYDLSGSLWDEIVTVSPAWRALFLAFLVCIIYALHCK